MEVLNNKKMIAFILVSLLGILIIKNLIQRNTEINELKKDGVYLPAKIVSFNSAGKTSKKSNKVNNFKKNMYKAAGKVKAFFKKLGQRIGRAFSRGRYNIKTRK